MRFLLVLVPVLLLSSCCLLDGTCNLADEAQKTSPVDDEAVLSSPGCAPESIDVQGAVVCADCAFAGDSICGAPNEAQCEARENSVGDACQLCVTADGVILYDDCFTGEGARSAAFCEESAGLDEGESCTVCFDDDGNTVSTTCGPRADECAQVVSDDGRLCTRCTTDGEVVSNVCETVDIDPRLCRSYGNEQGECVDCFGDDNALLSHSCAPLGATTSVSCQETVQPEGLVCTVCVDENGTTIDRFCQESIPEPRSCGQLVFTEQTCIVCVDDVNAVVSIDCQRNDCGVDGAAACRIDADCTGGQVCFDGACVAQNSGAPTDPDDPNTDAEPGAPTERCEPPPPCTMDVGDDGAVCRTCPVTGADGVAGSETRCVSTGLACDVEPESEVSVQDGEDDAGFAPPPPEDPQGSTCVICRDTASGVEVYRDCGSNGSVPPPYCLNEDSGDGTPCSVCFDAVSDASIYTSCGDETCFALESEVLVDAEQAPLLVDGEPATAACQQCGTPTTNDAAGAAEAFSASCTLDNLCQDSIGTNYASCPATSLLTLAPQACANPWDVWVRGDSDVDLLRGVLAFALAERGLGLVAASVVVAAAAEPPVCDGCACETGMRIELLVPEADAEVAAALFDGYLLR